MVDLLIMSGVFFCIVFLWSDCGCVVTNAFILLVPFVLFPPDKIRHTMVSTSV